jgi:hypothetical protein
MKISEVLGFECIGKYVIKQAMTGNTMLEKYHSVLRSWVRVSTDNKTSAGALRCHTCLQSGVRLLGQVVWQRFLVINYKDALAFCGTMKEESLHDRGSCGMGEVSLSFPFYE